MNHGGNLQRPFGARFDGDGHVFVLIEVPHMKERLGGFCGDGGCEGPELLPFLHGKVHAVPHVRAAGVGKNGAVAEGPGAELHAPLEPAHDLSRFEEAYGAIKEIGWAFPAQVLGMGRECDINIPGRIGRTEVESGYPPGLHGDSASALGDQSSTKGRAWIPGGGLHEQAVKQSTAIQHAVQAAVQGHTAREAKVARAVDFLDGPQEAQNGALQGRLKPSGDGDVAGFDGVPRLSGGTQPPAPAQGAAGWVLQQGRDGEVVFPQPLDLPFEEGQVGVVLPVGRQAHDLVFILDGFEAQEVGAEGIEQAQGAGGRQGEEGFQIWTLTEVEAERGGLAVAVHHQHEAPVEPREVVGAGGVGQVVVYGLHSRKGLPERGDGCAGPSELGADGLLHARIPAARGLDMAGQVRLGQVEVMGRREIRQG